MTASTNISFGQQEGRVGAAFAVYVGARAGAFETAGEVLSRGKLARAMLAGIYNWFTEGFDSADLRYAKSFDEELSV